jgi:ribosomal protein L11 methyltransferase
MNSRRWLTLSVRVHRADRPRLDGLLVDWATLGLVEAEAEVPDIEQVTAHFSTEKLRAATLESRCRRALTVPPFGHPVAWRVAEEPDRDWTLSAREYFTGVRVSDRLSILPPWAPRDHPLAAAPVVLRIDPGMAFGTGTHESTRLALNWLEERLPPGDSVLDLGSGSAILAIAAAKLGAGHVTAVEIDPAAEENALRNLALNGVSDRVEHRVENFTRAALDPADVVLCNMLVEEFEPHLERLRGLTRPGGSLILAGLLVIDEAAVTEGLRGVGLHEIEIRREGEWSSIRVIVQKT